MCLLYCILYYLLCVCLFVHCFRGCISIKYSRLFTLTSSPQTWSVSPSPRHTPKSSPPSSTSPSQSWTWASLPRQTAVSKKDRFNNTLRLKFKAGCLWVLQTGFLFPLQCTLCTACTPCPTTRGASWGGTTQPSARTLRWSSGTATTTPGAQRTLFL